MNSPKPLLLTLTLLWLNSASLVYGDACLNLISIRLKKVVDRSSFDYSLAVNKEDLSIQSFPDNCFYIVGLSLTQQSFDKTKETKLEYIVTNSIEFEEKLTNDTLTSEDITLQFAERIEIKKLTIMFLVVLSAISLVQVWTLCKLVHKD
jgi:hypothetical protein